VLYDFLGNIIHSSIPALITGIITYFVAVKQNRYEIKKIEKQVENNLIEYNSKELLEIKRKAVFDSLALIDEIIKPFLSSTCIKTSTRLTAKCQNNKNFERPNSGVFFFCWW